MASLLASCGRLSGRNCRIIAPADMRRYVRTVHKFTVKLRLEHFAVSCRSWVDKGG